MTVYTNINQTHITLKYYSTKASEINSFGLLQYFFILNANCLVIFKYSLIFLSFVHQKELKLFFDKFSNKNLGPPPYLYGLFDDKMIKFFGVIIFLKGYKKKNKINLDNFII